MLLIGVTDVLNQPPAVRPESKVGANGVPAQGERGK